MLQNTGNLDEQCNEVTIIIQDEASIYIFRHSQWHGYTLIVPGNTLSWKINTY